MNQIVLNALIDAVKVTDKSAEYKEGYIDAVLDCCIVTRRKEPNEGVHEEDPALQ